MNVRCELVFERCFQKPHGRKLKQNVCKSLTRVIDLLSWDIPPPPPSTLLGPVECLPSCPPHKARDPLNQATIAARSAKLKTSTASRTHKYDRLHARWIPLLILLFIMQTSFFFLFFLAVFGLSESDYGNRGGSHLRMSLTYTLFCPNNHGRLHRQSAEPRAIPGAGEVLLFAYDPPIQYVSPGWNIAQEGLSSFSSPLATTQTDVLNSISHAFSFA